MGLDCPTHLGEEVEKPKKVIPYILVIVVISQAVVGIIWILALGFSMTNLDAVLATTTGVPILELIRHGTESNVAAIVFCVILLINNATSALGSAVTMSRQGYAFARDGGLLWNKKLTQLSPRTSLPVWSINVPSIFTVLIGLIYLFSSAAFNAIIGSQAVCMILSFGCPALIMLLTGGSTLPMSGAWNFGRLSKPIYIISVLYSALVVLVALVSTVFTLFWRCFTDLNILQIPQVHPVSSLTMNYTPLVLGAATIAIAVAWFTEGRKHYSPPTYEEMEAEVVTGVEVVEEKPTVLNSTKELDSKA
jgi:choline transport protein